VKATDIGRLHPAIEATAYYIAAEATANAVKHARAHQVEKSVESNATSTPAHITDDVGGAAVSGGTGLRGLCDRADALGAASHW
jgi:signal transduction histidine kinase